MSVTVRVAIDGEWKRAGRVYERKYGVGFGLLLKDLRAVQSTAFTETAFNKTPTHLVTSLPEATCTPNSIPLVQESRARSIRGGDPAAVSGQLTKDYYQQSLVTSAAQPLWVNVRSARVLRPPNATLQPSKEVAPLLAIQYADDTTRHVEMREAGDDLGACTVRDLTTLRADEGLTDPFVKLVYSTDGRRFVVDNQKPFARDSVFRVMRASHPESKARCYANKVETNNSSRCPVNAPFMPTCRVPIVSMLREHLIFDVKLVGGGVHTVRSEYVEHKWKLVKLDQQLIDASTADLSRPRTLRVFNIAPSQTREEVDPIDVVATRGPRITDLGSSFLQQNGRCDTSRWKRPLTMRANFERGVGFFTRAHVGTDVVFDFDYSNHTCGATLVRGAKTRRVAVVFRDDAPEDGFGGRVSGVTHDSVTLLSPLDGMHHTIPNPRHAMPDEIFVYTLHDMRRGVPYRDFVLRTTRVGTVASSEMCCELGVVRRRHNHQVEHVLVPLDACAAPFYFKMRRASDAHDTFDFFCNTRLHASEAICAHVRAHDAPLDVTSYHMPRFEVKDFCRDDALGVSKFWDVRQADAYQTADVRQRETLVDLLQFEDDDTAWTDYGHRHEDDALITLQHHLDFKYGPGTFLVLANPKYSFRNEFKATPDGLVLQLPLVVVQSGDGFFQIEETTADRSRPWSEVRGDFFVPCARPDAEAPRVDATGRCTTPLQLVAGVVIWSGDACYTYSPYKWTQLRANVEAKSHRAKTPMRANMLASVAEQAVMQRLLIKCDRTYVVSWTPNFSTVYEIKEIKDVDNKEIKEIKDVQNNNPPANPNGNRASVAKSLKALAECVAANNRGEMVRSAIRRKTHLTDDPPPSDASIALDADTMRCVPSNHASDDPSIGRAVTMRVLLVVPAAAHGKRADDGAIVRDVQCTDASHCAIVYDDAIERPPSRLMATPLASYCLQNDLVSPTRRIYLLDASTSCDALALVLVEDVRHHRWSAYDTLERALLDVGSRREDFAAAPLLQPNFQLLDAVCTTATRLVLQQPDEKCILRLINIPPMAQQHASNRRSDKYAFAINIERDIARLMRRLPCVRADQRTNKRAFANWWCDLMLLIALRPTRKTYVISIDPSLATEDFKMAAVDAVVMFDDMARDAADAMHGCSPQGHCWRRIDKLPAHASEPTDAAVVRQLLEAAWAATEVDADTLQIAPPPFRYTPAHHVRITNPHTRDEALFAPVCEQAVHTADYNLIREIFAGKPRPLFKDIQLEKRAQERITANA